MESDFAWSAFLGALVGSLIVGGLTLVLIKRSLERGLSAPDLPAQGALDAGTAPAPAGERFAEIAPELVTLARSATDSAVRREELHEWHQPDLFSQSEDDISQTIRAKLRRATFNVAVAKSALQGAIRRHGASVPAELRSELTAFAALLDAEDGGTPSARKRRLAAELDALEARIRDSLGDSGARPAGQTMA